MPIVTLPEAKAHLQIATSAHDAQLTGYLPAASAVVERYVGAVESRPVVEVHSGAGLAEIVLRTGPVLTLTSVVEDGQTVDPSGYRLTGSGLLVRVSGSGPLGWRPGVGNISVSYTAGRSPIPEHLKLAANLIIGHLWSTQRNTAGGRPPLGGDELQLVPGFGFLVPNQAVELLRADMNVGV